MPTPAWLKRTFKQPWQRIWYEGYSVNLAVGQGQLAITPLQLAVAYSTLANGGTVVRPHVGRAVATGRLGDPAALVLRRMADGGRVEFPVAVEMTDAGGTKVAEMTVHWIVRRNT